jgi:hypothetical protein
MVNPPEYDDILAKIERLPEKWNNHDNKEIKLNIVVHREEADWVLSRIFVEVDRNLVSATIKAKSSEYSIELDVILTVIGGLVAKKSIDILLDELKDYLKKKWKIHKRKKKNKKLRE